LQVCLIRATVKLNIRKSRITSSLKDRRANDGLLFSFSYLPSDNRPPLIGMLVELTQPVSRLEIAGHDSANLQTTLYDSHTDFEHLLQTTL
jgi:hypothetical protein